MPFGLRHASNTYGGALLVCYRCLMCDNREDLTLSAGISWSYVFVCARGVLLRLAAVACGGASCSLRNCWVIAYLWVDHLRSDWVVLFVLHDPSDALV